MFVSRGANQTLVDFRAGLVTAGVALSCRYRGAAAAITVALAALVLWRVRRSLRHAASIALRIW